MAYFNYFIKCFIRIFTKKYFKHLLLFLIIFIGFIFFNNSNVFAVTYTLDETYFTQADIDVARSKVGESIWNNTDYDIFLGYKSDWGTKVVAYTNIKAAYDKNPNANLRYTMWLDNNVLYMALAQVGVSGYYNYDNANSRQLSLSSNLVDNYSNFFEMVGNLNGSSIRIYPIRSHYDMYFSGTTFSKTTSFVTPPYFITNDTDLQTFNFDYLQISGGTTKYKTTFMGQDYYARFNLKYIYNGVTTNIEILDDYISYNSTDNTWQINIPYNALTNSVVVRNGGVFRYVLEYDLQYETGYDISTNELTYDLTSEQVQNINDESNKQLQSQILDATQQTNQSINVLNGSINNLDTSINDSNISDINNNTLPQDSTQDITSNGVNGIFQSIYNAFCVGQPQDIVFPFPFTNQNIVLSPSYVRNALTNSNASFIITLIQAFWWYIISRFIIKDIMNKINKIKSGNIEDIEKTNIRGDML